MLKGNKASKYASIGYVVFELIIIGEITMFGRPKKQAYSSMGDLTEEQKKEIIKLLSNRKYRGRTLIGISRETKIPAGLIKTGIRGDRNFAKKLKIFPKRTKDGDVLITTKERFVSEASLEEKFTDFFASNRQEIDFGG